MVHANMGQNPAELGRLVVALLERSGCTGVGRGPLERAPLNLRRVRVRTVLPPSSPHLELSYYFEHLRAPDALAHVVRVALASGGVFAGSAWFATRKGIRGRAYRRPLTREHRKVTGLSTRQLELLLDDQGTRIAEVHFHNLVGRSVARYEAVTTLSSRVRSVRHTVAIWTDGDCFFGLPGREAACLRRGLRASRRFLSLAQSLRPTYGAMTIDTPVDTPRDLARGGPTAAFRDFYVSNDVIARGWDSLPMDTRGAFRSSLDLGIYVSSSREFNPRQIELSTDSAWEMSRRVSAQISLLCA
jgi:hypothetical protein